MLSPATRAHSPPMQLPNMSLFEPLRSHAPRYHFADADDGGGLFVGVGFGSDSARLVLADWERESEDVVGQLN
jgi:hypothetical protein